MSLVDNSNQKMGDNNHAIQVAGDLNFGNSTTEIIDICQLVVRSEMASLRQESLDIANSRALAFGNQIIEKLSSEVDEVVMKKLRDPDIQYAMNQSVTQVARKGLGAKSDLLKELLVTKIKNNEEEQDLLIDHALEITPRLTTSELKFLSLIYCLRLRTITINGLDLNAVLYSSNENININGINKSMAQSIWTSTYQDPLVVFDKITADIETISPINLSMLEIKGCINSGQHYTKEFLTLVTERTGIKFKDSSEFRKKFQTLSNLFDKFGMKKLEKVDSAVLSKLGTIIAENYLSARNILI